MGWESSDIRFDLWPPPSRSNDGSLASVSYRSGGYKFASVLRCVGLVFCFLYQLFFFSNPGITKVEGSGWVAAECLIGRGHLYK